MTEVHHVNGEGEDAGVVYLEMQSKETACNTVAHRALVEELYPGTCGYRHVTGGCLENLRTSTTNEKVPYSVALVTI